MTALPSFADIEDAAWRLDGLAVRTPLVRADALDAAAGAPVWVKAECLQRTGSFKFRGAYNRLSRLTPEQRTAGVVAFSSGNHGQGVAAAARMLEMPAAVVMPADAPRVKIEATQAYGAEIVLYDRTTQSREAIAADLAAARGAVVVPSFDDLHVIAGQGTVGLEAACQLADLGVEAAAVVCPVSGGGLIGGIALAFEALSPSTRIHAAEPAGYDDHRLSLRAGRRLGHGPTGPSLCDALLAPMPGELTFAINGPRLAEGLVVTDEEALAAVAFAFRRLKLVLEPGGAVALAAVLHGRLDASGPVLVIASGGNVDSAVYARAISRG